MYRVHNKEFYSQKEIKDYLASVVRANDNKPILGDDFILFKELIMYVPAYRDMRGEITQMTGRILYNIANIASYKVDFIVHRLKYGRKTIYEDKKENIYTGSMIEYLPPVKELTSTISYIFKFGKYKGMNIEDVNDMSYLYWVTGENSTINKAEKALIKKFIRYGFIPYNPPYEKS